MPVSLKEQEVIFKIEALVKKGKGQGSSVSYKAIAPILEECEQFTSFFGKDFKLFKTKLLKYLKDLENSRAKLAKLRDDYKSFVEKEKALVTERKTAKKRAADAAKEYKTSKKEGSKSASKPGVVLAEKLIELLEKPETIDTPVVGSVSAGPSAPVDSK